jgi:alkylated DNA repair dioxygenase AlkB
MLFQDPFALPMQDADVRYYPALFAPHEADALLATLRDDTDWRSDDIIMFGKAVPQPRLTAWYGDSGKSYTYSGLTMQPMPWTKTLLEIKSRIEPLAGVAFNSVLLNYYRTGTDSMSWHSDDEPELGINPVIGSLSLGAERVFHFKHCTLDVERPRIVLQHGSFLLMAGSTQHHWMHQLPKTAKPVGPRINLTFRVVG